MIGLYPWSASWVSRSARLEASAFGLSSVNFPPYYLTAAWIPAYAESLKDLSPRPPVS
jgi:hypothetical protein